MGPKPQPAPETNSNASIARQPILSTDETVVGYELFFAKDSEPNSFRSGGDAGTTAAIDTLNLVGLDVLCDGRLAFINCSYQMLLAEYFALLPPQDVVIELQETVPADEKAIRACQKLRQSGYSVALDNFAPGDPREALIPHADYIKVDTLMISATDCAAIVAQHGKGRRMLAHKVETRERFVNARKNGFTWFQGYFFRHPESMRARQIPANQATFLRLLNEVSKSEVDFGEIETLIKHEPSLTYRLLRYLNSPLLGLSSPVLSVRHALDLLGEIEAARWIRLATTLVMGQNKSSDLVLASLVRARFCELIAIKVDHGKSDLFLMGMLSLMDAILSVPIGMVIKDLSLEPDVKAQLLGAKTGAKTPLSPIYDLMLAQEAGDWGRVSQVAKTLNLSLAFVGENSRSAMIWARQITSTVAAAPAR
jgi:EAL and modified HD-GYP domain-containing signal transduction protein